MDSARRFRGLSPRWMQCVHPGMWERGHCGRVVVEISDLIRQIEVAGSIPAADDYFSLRRHRLVRALMPQPRKGITDECCRQINRDSDSGHEGLGSGALLCYAILFDANS